MASETLIKEELKYAGMLHQAVVDETASTGYDTVELFAHLNEEIGEAVKRRYFGDDGNLNK